MAMARQKQRVNNTPDRKFFLTLGAFEAFKQELVDLIGRKPELAKKIGLTASFGDLPENHAWDAAKEEEAFLDGRIGELRAILKNTVILEKTKHSKVEIGAEVTLNDGEETFKILLVDSLESKPSSAKISVESPFGRALLGKKIGTTAKLKSPSGVTSYKILAVD